MAKVISIVGSLSGKLAGTVYSHNRWGNYIRQLVMPTQPRTVYQQNQRARIASVAERWHDLTPSDRLQWGAFAPLIVRSDRLGQPLSYNGFTAFMLVNTERLFVGEVIKDDPPMFWQGDQPDTVLFTVAASTMSLTNVMSAGGSLVDTGTNYLIAWSCPYQAAGAMFAKTWRAFSVQDQNTAFPINLSADWASRFGAIQAASGRRYFLGVTLVNVVDAPPGSQEFYIASRVDATVVSTLA
jgi:hypothetical protein